MEFAQRYMITYTVAGMDSPITESARLTGYSPTFGTYIFEPDSRPGEISLRPGDIMKIEKLEEKSIEDQPERS
jgi:hypothetical protein